MGVPSSPLLPSPFSSPNVAALLKIKILSWSQETGFPVCVRVRIGHRTFNLHKLPLTSKSGYFRENLKDTNEVELPQNFPGGAETFEMIALFLYGSSTLVDPFNVAALRCAAEFLRMTEEYRTGNLCQRFDIYLNQVVLQSWSDTLIVLQKCQNSLLPWAEDLLIVSRCIETLAFMACMEILDPERRRRRDQPVITLEALSRRSWTDQMMREVVVRDPWIQDLISLPLVLFRRVVGSLRRQGMKEKYVSPIVLFYAHKWLDGDGGGSVKKVLEGVVDLLPSAGNKVVPVGFYLSLLSASIRAMVREDCVEKLQNQIVLVLHLAQPQDLLLPKDNDASCIELSVMETIFSKYFDLDSEYCTTTPVGRNDYHAVAELWDAYLNQIATTYDSEMISCKRFVNLIETIPISSRQTHDHLYRAINTFFKWHPNLSEEEKGLVWQYLNCQKLSQEVCIKAVENEATPLRLVVQALFVQQLNTQRTLRECSDSFRYTDCGDLSRSLQSPGYMDGGSEGGGSRPLGMLLQRDTLETCRREYESTSFRIQNLEKEVMSLKRSLQLQQTAVVLKKKEDKRPRHGVMMWGCITNVKYANRILRILQRVTLFGRSRRES